MIKKINFNNLKWLILFVSLLGFIILTYVVFNEKIIKLDIIGYELISNLLMSDFLTKIFIFITNLGSSIFLIITTIILFILIRNKKVGIFITLNLLITTGLNTLLKYIIQRPRPTEFRLIEENGYSFPSGHTMVSMTFYGLLIYLIYKNIKNNYLKWSLISILILLICLIGISRIYLGVHYPSDVIAGFFVASSYLILYINIIKKYIFNK